VPYAGLYNEILNSDALEYGGGGIGNCGGVVSDHTAWHGRPYSLNLNLPPLGASIFYKKENVG
jgi:1,4-alpha-glucan branching enzyme